MRAPRRTPPSLGGIADVAPEEVDWAAGLDGLRVAGGDLSGRSLAGVTVQESELVDLRAGGTRLDGCRFLDVRLDRLDAPDLVAAKSVWRDSEVIGSRIGALSLHGAKVTALLVDGCKIDYLNLRGAVISDLVVTDCAIGELDLGDAELARASFAGCTIGTLGLHSARLVDVDLRGARLAGVTSPAGLRGATVSRGQLVELAPVLAAELGLRVG